MKKTEKILSQIADRKRQKEQHEAKRVPIQQRITLLAEMRNEHLLGIADGKESSAGELERIDTEAAKLSRALADNQTVAGLIDKKLTELESEMAAAKREEQAEAVKDLLRACRKNIPAFNSALDKTSAVIAEMLTTSDAIDAHARELRPEKFGRGLMSAKVTMGDILMWDLYFSLSKLLTGMPGGRPAHLPSLEVQLEAMANELGSLIG